MTDSSRAGSSTSRRAALSIALFVAAGIARAVPPPDPEWERSGRPLPEPRFFQPRLDDRLHPYVLRSDIRLSGRLEVRSTAILAELVERWGAEFEMCYPDVQIELAPPYVPFSDAVSAMISGKASAAFVSGEDDREAVEAFRRRKGYAPVKVSICGGSYDHFGFMDAGAVIVNQSNPLTHISLEQLAAIYASRPGSGHPERITTWGQLGLTGAWADQPIHAWRLRSGALEVFMRRKILAGDAAWHENLRVGESVGDIQAEVQSDRYAIGTNKLAYMLPTTRALAISTSTGGVYHDASYEAVARGLYPLSRVIDLHLDLAPGKRAAPVLTEFVRFILSREGQQVVLDQGVFLPLRAHQAAESEAILNR